MCPETLYLQAEDDLPGGLENGRSAKRLLTESLSDGWKNGFFCLHLDVSISSTLKDMKTMDPLKIISVLLVLAAGGGVGACRKQHRPAAGADASVLRQDVTRNDTVTVSDLPGSSVERRPSPCEEIYELVEEMPAFPGGQEELRRYISGHLRYPGPEAGKEIEGKAVVRLAVMSDGSVGEVRIARSLDPYLDKEAVHVVSEMPRWIPGRHEGKAVNVWVVLPVEFARDASGGLRLK